MSDWQEAKQCEHGILYSVYCGDCRLEESSLNFSTAGGFETIHVPPGGLPSPVKRTFAEDMTEAIQHGDVAGRLKAAEEERDELIRKNAELVEIVNQLDMLVDQACDLGEDSESELAALKAGISGQELPPLDVTKEEESYALRYYGCDANGDHVLASRLGERLLCRERQLRSERMGRETAEAKLVEQAAELAGKP